MGFLQMNLISQILNSSTRVTVILPEIIVPGKGLMPDLTYIKGRKYQTLYLLHGGGGDSLSYIRSTQIEMFANEHELAVIMPEVNYSFYCDMKHGKKYFSYLTQELPEMMESVLPITSNRDHRFVAGFSMGSHGALKWALRYPEFFAASAAMSGANDFADLQKTVRPNYDPNENNNLNNSFGSLQEYRNSENDVVYLAKKLVESKGYMPKFYSCCGTEDFSYQYCLEFNRMAQQIGFPITFEEGPGAHDWRFCNQYLERVINWLPLTKDPIYE